MVRLNILRDTREQRPWAFDDFDVEIRDVTINTGDYTLVEFCDHDGENDTYHPRYAVERKGGDDFIDSITRSRERFKREVKRAQSWDSELLVLIEAPRRTFKRREGFMQYRDVSWNVISSTVEKWERYYNVNFRYAGSRERCQQIAFDALSSWLRAMLTSEG
jgi:ERCC4-type nuclease